MEKDNSSALMEIFLDIIQLPLFQICVDKATSAFVMYFPGAGYLQGLGLQIAFAKALINQGGLFL